MKSIMRRLIERPIQADLAEAPAFLSFQLLYPRGGPAGRAKNSNSSFARSQGVLPSCGRARLKDLRITSIIQQWPALNFAYENLRT